MVDGLGASAYAYDAAGQLLSEDGPWENDTVAYTYQNRLRQSLTVPSPGGPAWAQSYDYDPARRLTNVVSPAGEFDYAYNAGQSVPVASHLIRSLRLPNAAYITNTFDSVARLTGTWLKNSRGTNLDLYRYVYNPAGQRTNVIRTAGDSVAYTYDNIGELKSALGKEAGGATRWQEKFGYVYDAAGNLSQRTNNTLLQRFNVNNLNELTTVTNGGRLTVAGSTTSPATNVTINTSNALVYADVTFASTNQPWKGGANLYTAIAKDVYGRRDTNSITVSLAGTNNFSYDLNGNLSSDGTRGFDYDDENQLIRVTVTNVCKTEFAYDGWLRRRVLREYNWQPAISDWQLTNEVHYLYDGNLVIQERDGNNALQVTYTRGLDLGGTLQGAGGIGGLLARADANGSAYYHADGNGNITALTSANQMIVAKYLYDPYGNTLSMYGPLADVNKYRFSSKEWNVNSGLYYYGYRYYEPNLQRWLNQDPIGERGGLNLYGFVGNSPINRIDPLGLVGLMDDGTQDHRGIWSDSGVSTMGPNPPSTAQSFIPIYGSLAQASYDYNQGNWGWGTFNAGLAVSDAVPIDSLLGGLGKGLWKFGSHTWDATRKWLTKCRWREFPGQEMHHWAIPQNEWGANIPEWLKNQPWNLTPMPNDVFHDALHGVGQSPFNFGERLWYGTPNWVAASAFSLGGREANFFSNPGSGTGLPGFGYGTGAFPGYP